MIPLLTALVLPTLLAHAADSNETWNRTWNEPPSQQTAHTQSHTQSHTPLITDGRWILNGTDGRRVRLRCANWYGAHQELHVVGGLELRSVSRLADLFQATGANCVRLPFSVEMVKHNPPVPAHAVAGILPTDGCGSTGRALDVMDCVVSHLQRRGILLIFNSHNSRGTWVGAGAAKPDQGLWNLPGYSTEDWIRSMETIARRYKVAGMDLRNEIHDQDGVRITWGESDDVDTDWLAASSAAYERLHRVDPDMLAIVGGLCWNTDIHAMMRKVGPAQALRNRKLVYTVHVYSFSFWWDGEKVVSEVLTPMSIWLFLGCLSASIVCFYFCGHGFNYIRHGGRPEGYELMYSAEHKSYYYRNKMESGRSWQTTALAFLSASVLFSAGGLALAVFYYNTAIEAGCSSFAADSTWLVILASTALGVAVLAGAGLLCGGGGVPWHLLASFSLLWLGLLSLGVFAVGTYLSTYASYFDAFDTWSLRDRPVPVWVGEFGTGTPDEPIFRLIWEFINARHDLDFAYWAFNGRKWRDGAWESEGFGLLDDAYAGWRLPEFVRAIFQG
jgi:hypothetical protein